MKEELIHLDKLKSLFESMTKENKLILSRICCSCGIEFNLEIHKTSQGFGLLGGVLFMDSPRVVAMCEQCFNKCQKDGERGGNSV